LRVAAWTIGAATIAGATVARPAALCAGAE
jgi:hypothetical protein